MIPLPPYIDADLWAEYVQQRKKDKKEMTPRSAMGRLKRLIELKDAGHDPNACIEEALNAHWLDFYAPRDKTIEKAPASAVESTRAVIEAQRLTPQERAESELARQRVMAAVRPGIRRVA